MAKKHQQRIQKEIRKLKIRWHPDKFLRRYKAFFVAGETEEIKESAESFMVTLAQIESNITH